MSSVQYDVRKAFGRAVAVPRSPIAAWMMLPCAGWPSRPCTIAVPQFSSCCSRPFLTGIRAPESHRCQKTAPSLGEALSRPADDEASGSKHTAPKKANKMAPDRRQPALLLPVPGGRKRKAQAVAEPTTPAARQRKQATI